MHTISSTVVKVFSIFAAFLIFFAISGALGSSAFVTPIEPVHDAVSNIAIRDTFQLVDNLSYSKLVHSNKDATNTGESNE